ncbi:MAG: hypothetical protein JXL67_02715 [Calditrichaeota bacterium]|nr:hypothetical protein [Calditrichota bacterium]
MIEFYIKITALLLGFLLLEFWLLTRAVRAIPVRILVNGTRGKTTTVKILHEIFRQAGWKVYSKTTGDEPLLHFPDGTQKRLHRHGPANIRENIPVLRAWGRKKAEIVIMESMALIPETQQLLTQRIFRPTHYILTNILPDHLETMGTDRNEIFETLRQSFPREGKMFFPASLKEKISTLKIPTDRLDFSAPVLIDNHFPNISPDVISQNHGLVQSLTDSFQLNQKLVRKIFRREWKRISDSLLKSYPEKNFDFLNLFSVNDPESTLEMIRHFRKRGEKRVEEIFLFNARADRPYRSLQFIDLFKENFPEKTIWVCGSGKFFFRNFYRKEISGNNIFLVENNQSLLSIFKNGFDTSVRIYGCGNHKGMQQFLEQLRVMT